MVAAPVEVPTCVSLTHSQPSNRMVWLSARPAPTGEWHVLKSLQFRTACEQSQEELYQIAREKSYYVPAEKATAEEVAHVRSLFTQGTL